MMTQKLSGEKRTGGDEIHLSRYVDRLIVFLDDQFSLEKVNAVLYSVLQEEGAKMTDLYIWLTLLLSLPGALSCALEVYEWLRKRKESS